MCALLFCFAPTFQFMPNAANSDSPPFLSKEGNSGLPSAAEEGVGAVGHCGLGVLCALA